MRLGEQGKVDGSGKGRLRREWKLFMDAISDCVVLSGAIGGWKVLLSINDNGENTGCHQAQYTTYSTNQSNTSC